MICIEKINEVVVTKELKELTKRLCDLADQVDGINSVSSDSSSSSLKKLKAKKKAKAMPRRVTWDQEKCRTKFFDSGISQETEDKSNYSSFKKKGGDFSSEYFCGIQPYKCEIQEAPEEGEDEDCLKISLNKCPPTELIPTSESLADLPYEEFHNNTRL